MAGRFSPGVLPTPNKHWGESLADALGQGIQSYEHFKGRREAAEEQERERSRQEDADYMSGIRPEGFDFEDETPDGTGGLLSQALPQAPPQPAEAPPVQGPAVGEELAGVIDPQAVQGPRPISRSKSNVPGSFNGREGGFERPRLKPVQLPSGRMYDPNVVADQKYGERLAAAMAEREAEAAFPEPEKPVDWNLEEVEGGYAWVNPRTREIQRESGIRPKPPAPRQGPQGSWTTEKLADGTMVRIHSLTNEVRPVTMNGQPVRGQQSNGTVTADERKASAFLHRMGTAAANINAFDNETALNAISSKIPIFGNFWKTSEGRRLRQAGRVWAMAVLRPESGAAIPEDELDSYFETFLPRPGDDEATLAQKRQSRVEAEESIRIMAGRAAPPVQQQTTSPGTTSPNVSAIMQRYGLEP